MPQIVKAAGSRWFLTQKISWNQVNAMPHHTFNWEGIDGTRLFTHFPPADTYSSELSGRELAHAERNYRDHGRGTISLLPFGYGDGGGGPTREMLAAARRTADLEGSPKVQIGTAASFFARAQADYESLPVWVGEMYLELHRGTYTSQARTKLGNRRSEHLLREAELWCATAAVRAGPQLPGRGAQAALAAGAAAAVPRHPRRAAPSPGSTRTPSGTTPPSGKSSKRSSPALRPRCWAPAGGTSCSTPPRTSATACRPWPRPSRSVPGSRCP